MKTTLKRISIIIALIAGLITIFTFATGIVSLSQVTDFFKGVNIASGDIKTPSDTVSGSVTVSVDHTGQTGLALATGEQTTWKVADVYAVAGPNFSTFFTSNAIKDMGPNELDKLRDCPAYGYGNYSAQASLKLGHLYCVAVDRGRYYAKLRVNTFTYEIVASIFSSEISYVYQRNGTRYF